MHHKLFVVSSSSFSFANAQNIIEERNDELTQMVEAAFKDQFATMN